MTSGSLVHHRHGDGGMLPPGDGKLGCLLVLYDLQLQVEFESCVGGSLLTVRHESLPFVLTVTARVTAVTG